MSKSSKERSYTDEADNPSSTEITVETEIEQVLPEVKEENKEDICDMSCMSISEFAGSLEGTAALLASAMRIQYAGKKMSITRWKEELQKFAATEV